jgi:pilus assembly protein Flp/PilA
MIISHKYVGELQGTRYCNFSYGVMSCYLSENGAQTLLLQKGITIMLFAPKEKGQGLVEYAIILALVAIVVIAVMRLLGPKIGNTFSTINSSLP